jgi:hypothetical protein
MSQSNSPVNPQAHGLDLVREVLFGADKRQTSEEFKTLKTQLTEAERALGQRINALDKTLTAQLAALRDETNTRFGKLEAALAQGNTVHANALTAAQAASKAQHEAHLSALNDERAAGQARQAQFVTHMRAALDALTQTKTKAS